MQQPKNILTIALACVFAILVLSANLTTMEPVRGANTPTVYFDDISIADLGVHVYFSYSNVTYTSDGTGTDIDDWNSKIVGTPANRIKSLTNIRFGVGANDGIVEGETSVAQGSFKAQATNQTADEANTFEVQRKEDLGKFDYGSFIDSDTVYNHTTAQDSLSSLTLAGDYGDLNKSLYDMSENYRMDRGYFDGIENWDSSTEYETITVGYNSFKEGAIDDLKRYVAYVANDDFDDIKLQSVNLTSVYLTFNMSSAFEAKVKQLIDNSLIRANAAIMIKVVDQYGNSRLVPDFKTNSVSGLFDDFIGFVDDGIQTLQCNFGTPLVQLAQGVASGVGDIFTDPIGSITTAASDIFSTMPAILAGAMGTPASPHPQVEITSHVTPSTWTPTGQHTDADNVFEDEEIGVVSTVAEEPELDETAGISNSTWAWIIGIGVVVVIFLVVWRKTDLL